MSDDTLPEGPPDDPVSSWLWFSDADLKSARDAVEDGNWVDVYFHCQQAVEKRLKAALARQTSEPPPRIHRLWRLSELCGLVLSQEQEELMELLSSLYSDVRYPETTPRAVYSAEYAKRTLMGTEELIRWLDQKLGL